MFGEVNYSHKKLTAENILRKVDPASIFLYYAGYYILNKLMSSPLRKDNKPSFIISDKYGVVRYKDFSTGESGDCFKFIMSKYNCTYPESLEIINADFSLGLDSYNRKVNKSNLFGVVTGTLVERIESKTFIQITSRKWNEYDMDYWKPYGIHKKTLELYKVVPLSHYWLNGICFKVKDLTYAYDFGNGIYKIYAPLKDSFRFIFNGTEKLIQGIEQLTMLNNVLVITKSLKDVMVLREFGIDAVAPQAESIVIPENIMNWFSDHYQLIITLMDYDNAGISLSCKMRRLYNTTPMFFTDKLWNRKKGYRGAKDISDFIKLHGKEELRELVEIRRRKILPLVS